MTIGSGNPAGGSDVLYEVIRSVTTAWRRGQRPSRRGSALAVSVLALALLGGCSTTTWAKAPNASRTAHPGGLVVDPLGRPSGRISTRVLNMKEFLSAVATDVQQYWQRQLAKQHKKPPKVTLEWPKQGERVNSECLPHVKADQLGFYCPLDHTITVSQVLATEVKNGRVDVMGQTRRTADSGDLAVAFVVAHEYAHRVQDQLNIFDGLSTDSHLELHADCWAGVWANDAMGRLVLEDGNLGQAVAAAALVGDYNKGNPAHHGTPAERVAAFLQGYRGGSPDSCKSLLGKKHHQH